jgi:hypothetical protein
MASIKINGDVSGLSKSIKDVTRLTRELGKNKVSLISPETQKFFDGLASKEIDKVKSKIEQSERVAGKLAERMNDTARSTANRLKDEKSYLTVLQKQAEMIKTIKFYEADKRPGFIEGAGKAARGLPGVGKVTGAIGEMGLAGGLGMLAGGAAIGAGVYGVSRLAKGYGVYSQGIPSRIGLMGRGAYDGSIAGENQQGFAQTGMDGEAVRQARLQSMDIFGAGGSDQKSVLGRAQFATNYGIDLSTLQGAGAGMQSQVGTKGANRDILKLQASLQASEIKDAIGPYLESAASLLSDIRQNGLVNSNEVLGLMSSITKLGNSPQRAAQQISGFNNAVTNSSGETNALLQMAFNKAGIGGGTIGGTQAAIRSSGIFGLNLDDYKGLSDDARKNFKSMGFEQGADKRIGAILDQGDQIFGRGKGKKQSQDQMLAQDRFMMPILGAKSEVEAEDMMGMFRRGQTNPKEMQAFEAKLKDNNATPEEKSLDNLKKIVTTQEGALRALETIRQVELEKMGGQVAPAVMKMQDALFHIDKVISRVFGGIAGVVDVLSGGSSPGTPNSQKSMFDLSKYMPESLSNPTPERGVLPQEAQDAMAKGQSVNKVSTDDIQKAILDIQKEQLNYMKKTSQAVSKPKGAIPASGRMTN